MFNNDIVGGKALNNASFNEEKAIMKIHHTNNLVGMALTIFRNQSKSSELWIDMTSIDSVLVDHSPYDTMVEGLSPVAAYGNNRVKGKKHYKI